MPMLTTIPTIFRFMKASLLTHRQPPQCFLPLMRRHLARPFEPNTPLLAMSLGLATCEWFQFCFARRRRH
jgi:hypothetical protein